MEVIVCNSLNAVETEISKLRYYVTDFVFRGLPDHNYELQTRIEDKFKDKMKANLSAQRMIELFKMLIIEKGFQDKIYRDDFKYNTTNFKNDWLLYFQAQHLGIPTLLMDWSIDWKKALYFSVFDLHNQKKSGSLWVFNVKGFTYNDDSFNSKSIYHTNPFDYREQPRIINPCFDIGINGFKATKRIDYQSGRFFISSLEDSCEPIENNSILKKRLTKIIITPECKMDIIQKYSTLKEVPFILSGLPGVYSYKGNLFKMYNHNFFYGNMDKEILKTINSIRITEGFKVINI
jgi:hypothetical protein